MKRLINWLRSKMRRRQLSYSEKVMSLKPDLYWPGDETFFDGEEWRVMMYDGYLHPLSAEEILERTDDDR